MKPPTVPPTPSTTVFLQDPALQQQHPASLQASAFPPGDVNCRRPENQCLEKPYPHSFLRATGVAPMREVEEAVDMIPIREDGSLALFEVHMDKAREAQLVNSHGTGVARKTSRSPVITAGLLIYLICPDTQLNNLFSKASGDGVSTTSHTRNPSSRPWKMFPKV